MGPREVLGVMDALRAAGVRAYVGGGWGVDALLHEQTRPHRDLDISLDARDENRALEALRREGFSIAEDQRPTRLVLQHANANAVDLHPVVFDESGAGTQIAFNGVLDYPVDAFDVGEIDGVSVACFSAALQVRFHSTYAPSDIDRRDMTLLRERLGVPLPPQFE